MQKKEAAAVFSNGKRSNQTAVFKNRFPAELPWNFPACGSRTLFSLKKQAI